MRHRNSQQRIYVPEGIYFITTNTKDFYPYFKERVFGEVFMESLRLCKKLKEFKLFAWVLCYNHLHILFQPCDKFNYSKVMQFLKRHVSREINMILTALKGKIRESRLWIGEGRKGTLNEDGIFEKSHLRVRSGDYKELQPIMKEHCQRILLLKNRFHKKYSNKHTFPKFNWQRSFVYHVIKNNQDFENHLNYINHNPDKHNLPQHWPFIYTNPTYFYLIDDINVIYD